MPSLDEQIVAALDDGLRRAPWKGDPNPLSGHCYVASEALWYSLPDRDDWVPASLRHEGAVHWYLKHRRSESVRDLTAGQFSTKPDYSQGRGRGFLTNRPSKRAQIVLDRVAGVV